MSNRRSSDRPLETAGKTGVVDPFTVKTVKRTDGIIHTTASGTANINFVARLRYQLTAELDSEPHDWIFDASGVEKFDRDVSEPFVVILRAFKERKGGRVLAVAGDSLKMMFSSISMSSVASGGPVLEIVPTAFEAIQRLGKQGAL